MNLNNLQHNQEFETEILILDCELITSSKKPFVAGKCMNKYDTYEFKIWQSVDISTLTQKCHHVIGRGNLFNGKFGLIIEEWTKLDNQDKSRFYKCPPITIEKIKEGINYFIEKIEDQQLKLFTQTILRECDLKFYSHPAAKTNHDNCFGGLAHHSLKVVNAAYAMCKLRSQVNKDLVIVGAIVHEDDVVNEDGKLPR